MKITGISVLHCDAGWRTWSFVKIVTSLSPAPHNIVGWSEVTDSHGSPSGIEGVVRDLTPLLIGENPLDVERLYWKMYSRTRQSVGSIITKAIGGIENALLDIKGKYYGVPVYELFGGAIRKSIPLYWSHCGTSRVRAYNHVDTLPIKSLDDIPALAEEILRSGFDTIKTNIPIFESERGLPTPPHIYMPGFARTPGGPELNVTPVIQDAVFKWMRELENFLGSDFRIILDLNYNFKTEGYIQLGQMLDQFDLLWLEIDTYNPKALGDIRDCVQTLICSGENLLGLAEYRPFLDEYAMDIVSIDVIWNGFIRSMQIATLANLHELNVTPHNYYSNLATFITAQFCASIPNLRIMEYDVDDVHWRDDLCTAVPVIHNGKMDVPTRPGWGTDINEEVLRGHGRKI